MTQPIHPMLERVASKIMEARDGKPCKVKDWYCEEQENPHVAKALRQARAAVQALMEPDNSQVLEGNVVLYDHLTVDAHDLPELDDGAAAATFQAMLRPLVEGEGE